jgi:hypothetical protein
MASGYFLDETMTQVLQYDYGKSKVTLPEIRSAIKAVRAAKLAQPVRKRKSNAASEAGGRKVVRKAAPSA